MTLSGNVAHRYADELIVDWLNNHGYHPRSDVHGKMLCRFLLDDLLYESPFLREMALRGNIVYEENTKIGTEPLTWNIDLLLGPASQARFSSSSINIVADKPQDIWLAVDAKSVMTEHGKARRNRQRDLNSFQDVVKRYYPNCVTYGLMLLNMATEFKSPLRTDITIHRNVERLVAECIEIYNEIPRADINGGSGIEAVGVIVVNHTNIPGDETTLVTRPPAPQEGELANYRTTLGIIKDALEQRFNT